jgi:hypothetical protein
LEDQGGDGRIILKSMFDKQDGWIWLEIGACGALVNEAMNLRVP